MTISSDIYFKENEKLFNDELYKIGVFLEKNFKINLDPKSQTQLPKPLQFFSSHHAI